MWEGVCPLLPNFIYALAIFFAMKHKLAKSRAYREGGERACNSAYACTEGEMLAVTINRTKRVGVWQGSCAVCVDLQAVASYIA